MMYIEGHWETVDTLEEAIKVVREYYNEELADVMSELLDGLRDAYNDRIEEVCSWAYDDDDWFDD